MRFVQSTRFSKAGEYPITINLELVACLSPCRSKPGLSSPDRILVHFLGEEDEQDLLLADTIEALLDRAGVSGGSGGGVYGLRVTDRWEAVQATCEKCGATYTARVGDRILECDCQFRSPEALEAMKRALDRNS